MNVLITGAGKGIGFELCKLFAQLPDCSVFAVSRNIEHLTELNQSKLLLNELNCFKVDLVNDVDVKYFTENLKLKIQNLDIVIHNAGMLIHKSFQEFTQDDFTRIFTVNVWGIISLTQKLIALLKPGSHVVTISSMGGYQGSVKFKGLSLYSASKGAVAVLTESLAAEYQCEKIAFNSLALGAVQTEMLSTAFPEYNAPLKPEEMARFIMDFSINAHKYMNGKIIPVSLSTP